MIKQADIANKTTRKIKLSIIIICALSVAIVAAGTVIGVVRYRAEYHRTYGFGNYKQYINEYNIAEVVIPHGEQVIDESEFSHCDTITSIAIPDSVIEIGDRAFADCRSLKSVAIPDSVTRIGEHAFRYCIFLNNVTVPGSVAEIESFSFYQCYKLQTAVIQDGVKIIGNSAFCDCFDLESVTIPVSVTDIEFWAFGRCSRLKTSNYHGTVEQWYAINKSVGWINDKRDYVVYCADGVISN